MAYLKNKALFFTTSPRTPSKMIPEIQLLSEHFSGQKWNKQTQIAFIDLLVQSGFFEGSGSSKNKDFSARDRINRAPKSHTPIPIKINCKYFGLATNNIQTAIPRIMIAVLKLLYATTAKTGEIKSMILSRLIISPMRLGVL